MARCIIMCQALLLKLLKMHLYVHIHWYPRSPLRVSCLAHQLQLLSTASWIVIHAGDQVAEDLQQDISSRLLMTYRKDFPPIGENF